VCPFHQREANKSTSDTFMSSWSENTGHHFFCYTKDTSLPQSVFPSVVSCAGDGSEDSSDAAEAAMLFPAGTPVEVMYSFWPTDGIFLNGDWYKGWIQGAHQNKGRINAALDDGQSHAEEVEERGPVYTVLYADGDVSENVPHQHIRAGAHGMPSEEDDDGDAVAVAVGGESLAQVRQLQSEVDWGGEE
jgi:hypothetical protein